MPHFVRAGEARERADLVDAGHRAARARERREADRQGSSSSAFAPCCLFGHPEHGGKTPDGAAAAAADGAVQKTCERLKREFGDELIVMTDVCLCAYTDHGHCGILDDGRVLNDRVAGAARRHGREPCARRRRRRRTVRHDGRPRRRDPRCARRRRLRGHGADVVRREVRVGVLRPVPRSRGLDAVERRPAELPNGLPQPARSGARSAARRRRRRRLAHGEAGAALSRRDSRRARSEPAAAVGVQRLGRILGREGRSRERLARRGAHRAREPARDPPRRRRSDHHVSRARRAAKESGCDDSKGDKAAPKQSGSRATRGSSARRRSRRAA